MEKNDNADDRRGKNNNWRISYTIRKNSACKSYEGEEEELNRLQLIENYLE